MRRELDIINNIRAVIINIDFFNLVKGTKL